MERAPDWRPGGRGSQRGVERAWRCGLSWFGLALGRSFRLGAKRGPLSSPGPAISMRWPWHYDYGGWHNATLATCAGPAPPLATPSCEAVRVNSSHAERHRSGARAFGLASAMSGEGLAEGASSPLAPAPWQASRPARASRPSMYTVRLRYPYRLQVQSQVRGDIISG